MLVVKYNDQWFIFQQNFYNKNVGALMIIILNHYVLQGFKILKILFLKKYNHLHEFWCVCVTMETNVCEYK